MKITFENQPGPCKAGIRVMSPFAFMAWFLVVAVCMAAGVYLVVTEHYGWAWIPFWVAARVEVRTKALP